MKTHPVRVSKISLALATSVALGACLVNRFGADDDSSNASTTGTGGMTSVASTAAMGGSAAVTTAAAGANSDLGGHSATGGAGQCTPGATESCYGGPANTEGVGACQGGTRTCDAQSTWGPCVGEQRPSPEDCYTPADESCDGTAQCLPNAGLLVRYFLDEAANGKGPQTVVDSGPVPAANLDAVYQGSMQFTLSDGSRGLNWSSVDQDGRFQVSPGPGKMYNALNGQKTATIELVTKVQNGSINNSRFVAWGSGSGETDDFTFGAWNDSVMLRTHNDTFWIAWARPFNNTREVYHVVIDRNLAEGQRHRVFVNGAALASANILRNDTPGDAAFALGQGETLTLGNRHNGDRSLGGFIGYVAIYNEAFDSTRVDHHVALLSQGDDGSNVPVETP